MGWKHRPSLDRPHFRVGIAISPMKGVAIAHMNMLNGSLWCFHVARTAGTNSDPSHIYACLGTAGWYHRPHDVSRAEATHYTRGFGRLVWKASGIRAAHLPAMPPHCLNVQRNRVLHVQCFRRGYSHTGCIQPMSFCQFPLGAVPLGPPTRSRFHWQSRCFQLVKKRPTGRIHCCRVA